MKCKHEYEEAEDVRPVFGASTAQRCKLCGHEEHGSAESTWPQKVTDVVYVVTCVFIAAYGIVKFFKLF